MCNDGSSKLTLLRFFSSSSLQGAAVARAFFHSSILPQLETLSGRARSDLQAAIERESKEGQSLLSSLPSNDATPGPV